ncbi:hypothetical protein L484_019439 [Morus notabilis]|uniref:Glycosyl transferase family 1 domain-containing protein n=1 Tax=Morus notabilis TaxID=981085 RepID=W9SFG2_9ROSA|nr:hypothetical protein L484_019439 [Morus notabilis]
MLVGAFGSLEDRIFEWSLEKGSGTCNRKGDFARIVWSRRFVLIFHELSMTGAPLSMMELATELFSCGATVSTVALSKKGGLMLELARRRIKVLEDKANLSFKTAMTADLVIAGSAVYASWIDKMIEKRQLLRDSARKEMGSKDNDMLVISLSSINPGKGQHLLLGSGRLMIEKEAFEEKSNIKNPVDIKHHQSKSTRKHRLKTVFQKLNVGSKSNKVVYVKELLNYLSQHPNTSKSVLWTPASTGVAALYAATDVYVINSQVLGTDAGGTKEIVEHNVTAPVLAGNLEFLLKNPVTRKEMGMKGREKVERMYLKRHLYKKFVDVLVLGTDAGGTKEIVEHNVMGLLHPTGSPGAPVLVGNLEFLLKNPVTRKEMGMKGREKVERMYLKGHLYKKFVDVLVK